MLTFVGGVYFFLVDMCWFFVAQRIWRVWSGKLLGFLRSGENWLPVLTFMGANYLNFLWLLFAVTSVRRRQYGDSSIMSLSACRLVGRGGGCGGVVAIDRPTHLISCASVFHGFLVLACPVCMTRPVSAALIL